MNGIGQVGGDYPTAVNWVPSALWTLPVTHDGVGICWSAVTTAADNWNTKGYPGSIVKDPTGTILFVEQPNGRNMVDNCWFSFSAGPLSTSGNLQCRFQQCFQPVPAESNANDGNGYCQGNIVYKAHKMRFNYAFHDGHVEALDYRKTVGTGVCNAPADPPGAGAMGMWTLTPND
jgi:prepilin-type processing-associated H-X9-DG protein